MRACVRVYIYTPTYTHTYACANARIHTHRHTHTHTQTYTHHIQAHTLHPPPLPPHKGRETREREGAKRGGGRSRLNSFSPSTAFTTLHLKLKPSSFQLSHAQTHALQTKMHRCVEKAFFFFMTHQTFRTMC